MRELRTCDFCGGDAAGTFEVLPPELEPTEAEQRRVMLCPNCKPTLAELLEPLLSRAGDDTANTPAADTEESAANSDNESRSSEYTAGGRTENTVTEPSAQATKKTEPDTTHEDGITFEGVESAETGKADESEPTEADDKATGNTDESENTAAGDGEETGTGTRDGAMIGNDDAATTARSKTGSKEPTQQTDQPSQQTAQSSQTAQSTSRPPTAYSKVIRLLQNREFPMDRSAVENLAAGAYDLESYEVEAIVDYALEDGKFVEKGGQLRRP